VQPVDILILSNGPGEVTTWVKPVVRSLRQLLGDDREQVRMSLVLSPCPHATGREATIARRYAEIDRIQEASQFWPFLLWGRTADQWDWHDRGVVVFLGGDQIFPVIVGKRLRYRTVIYAEEAARWTHWIDAFAVMNPQVAAQAPHHHIHKLHIVGDLMAEVSPDLDLDAEELDNPLTALTITPETELIGLLPGSKPNKLVQGVPLTLAIAQHLHNSRPQTRFVIPVAPALALPDLAAYADPTRNPFVAKFGNPSATLIVPTTAGDRPYLQIEEGPRIELWTESPSYSLLSRCRLCLTTVGANTAELTALAVPMIVLLPTQQLDAMRAWGGIPGLLANLPGVGSGFARVINGLMLRRLGLLAWPNRLAGEQIVPELLGQLHPQSVANLVLDYLMHPEALQDMRDRLCQLRGAPGAAQKLARLVVENLL
jgi:lipid-A-disaccharide synthase